MISNYPKHYCLSKHVVLRALERIENLVPISGHQSLQRISSDDEGDGFVDRIAKLFNRRSDVRASGKSHRRNPGWSGWLFKFVENVEPTKAKSYLKFIYTRRMKLIDKSYPNVNTLSFLFHCLILLLIYLFNSENKLYYTLISFFHLIEI